METRKYTRLGDYNYSQNGCYFITICTKDRQCLFWRTDINSFVGASIARPNSDDELSQMGIIAKEGILNIPKFYSVSIDDYVIMPNHIHILISINNSGRAMLAPTISHIIQQYKGYVTKKIGFPIWQKLFYDHIVRNEQDYLNIREYILTNPLKWKLDKYYTKQED